MDYFKEDKYWEENINKELEDNPWILEYKEYLKNSGLCLDLGCGIGNDTKRFISLGYDVISSDISNIALEKVKEFNTNIVKLDMRKPLPFEDNKFDIVFANLSIHYFSDNDTKNIISEVKRVLKTDGLFIGSVNGLARLDSVKDTIVEIEHHYYLNNDNYFRLFDINDIKNYLSDFNIIKIDNKETVRFGYKKNYLIFIAKKY